MYRIASTHENISHPHSIKILNDFQGFTRGTLKTMEEREWIEIEQKSWMLTSKGYREASNLFSKSTTDDTATD